MSRKFLNGVESNAIKLTSSPGGGKQLVSDSSGNASWQQVIDNFQLLKSAVLASPSATSGNPHMAFDGVRSVYIYSPATTNSSLFKYDLVSGTTSTVSSTLTEAYAGATIIYVGGKLYYTRGGGFASFTSINPDGTSATSLTSSPSTTNFAGALAWDGDDYIYLLNGIALERYSISGNSWSTMAALPASPTEGAALTIVGTTIYAFRGAGTTVFWKYNIVTDAWSTMAVTPGTVYDGGCLAWNGGSHIYAFRGIGSQDFWRYSILKNTWESLQSLPIPASVGSTFLPLEPGSFLCYIAEPGALTGFGVVNNLYVYQSHQTLNYKLIKGNTRLTVTTSGSATAGAASYTDYVYLVAGAHTMTLPTAVGNTNRYTFKNNHSANVTINTTSSQTIDGGTSISIAPQEAVEVISNNANWSII